MEAPPLARLARIVTIHETAKSLVCTESQWRVRVGAFWSGGAADRAVRSPLQPCNEVFDSTPLAWHTAYFPAGGSSFLSICDCSAFRNESSVSIVFVNPGWRSLMVLTKARGPSGAP